MALLTMVFIMQSSLNPYFFIDKIIPESAYLLGFLWGDGYLRAKQYSICAEITQKDLLILKPTFDKTGNWNYFYRSRKNRQPQGGIRSGNKILFNFLSKLGYTSKSFSSHQLAIEHVPENFRHFWLRGYFDADGCVYHNKKNKCIQSSICSTYEQDWKYLINFYKEKDINFKLTRRIHDEKSSHSAIRICGKNNNFKLFNFLYPNQIYDGVGLKRKFDKFQNIDYQHYGNGIFEYKTNHNNLISLDH